MPLTIPAWVQKDDALLARVRRKQFPDQGALDLFLRGQAERRHRAPLRRSRRNVRGR